MFLATTPHAAQSLRICQEGMLSPVMEQQRPRIDVAVCHAKHHARATLSQKSTECGRAWALSCSLQSSVSQCLLKRSGSVAAIEKDIDFVALNF